MNYIKPELVALVPLLNVIGQAIKKKTDSKKLLKIVLLLSGFTLSTVYGLISSRHTGMGRILDAIVMTGLVQGTLITLLSFGTYDAAIKPLLKKEA